MNRGKEFFHCKYTDLGIEKDHYTYRVMMQMLTRGKQTRDAHALYLEMKALQANGSIRRDPFAVGILIDHLARFQKIQAALRILEEYDASLTTNHSTDRFLQDKYYRQLRKETEKLGIFTELIPEDPTAITNSQSHHSFNEKRKVRQESIRFNKKLGKKYVLPNNHQLDKGRKKNYSH